MSARRAHTLPAALAEPLRQLHDASPEAVIVLEPVDAGLTDFRFLYTNAAAERMLEAPSATFVGRTLRELFTPARFHDAQLVAYAAALSSGQARTFEADLPTLAGAEHNRWYRITAVPQGGLLHAVFVDITTSKRAERVLEVLAAASGSFTASLSVEATLQAVMQLVVPSLADVCGVDLRERNRVRARAAGHVQPALQEAAAELLRQLTYARTGSLDVPALLEKKQPVHLEDAAAEVGEGGELGAALAAARVQALLLVPLEVHGEVVGLMVWGGRPGVRFDAGDVVLAEEVGRRAAVALDNSRLFELSREERARAEEASRTKDEFLAVVSHELRQPLHAMLGWLRLYRSGSLPPEAREQALETVERNVHAQAALVEDLLDISRIVTGKLRLKLREVDMEEVVRASLASVDSAAQAKGIQLSSQVEPELPRVAGDPERLQQVVWNLLSNAIKFTPRAGQVSLTLGWREGQLELVVADTGAGIPTSFMPFVFERFRQAQPSATRTHRGLGLGLAIVKYVVELHGGQVGVESDGEGRGARFSVRLPVAPPGLGRPEPLSPSAPRRDSSLEEAPDLEGLSVLVADDEPEMRRLYTTLFQRAGARVVHASTAAEALALVPRARPDVLVFDIGLPDEDGYALLRRVRALPAEQGGGTPAVALTGHARSEDRTRAFLAGFQLHLPKPVEPAELLLVAATLAGRRQRL